MWNPKDWSGAPEVERIMHRLAQRKFEEVQDEVAIANLGHAYIQAVYGTSDAGKTLVTHYKAKWKDPNQVKESLRLCFDTEFILAKMEVRKTIKPWMIKYLTFGTRQLIADFVQWSIIYRWLGPFDGFVQSDEHRVDQHFRREAARVLYSLGHLGALVYVPFHEMKLYE
ncbi:MAG: hypothetical protein Q9222_002975 [Ikaeria aurantiellina]